MADNYLSTATHYARIWRQSVVMLFRVNTNSWLEFASYVIAKVLRMSFFFVFVYALFRNTHSLVGYSRGEVLLFFAFMNTIDVSFQLLCRGLTTIPSMVRKGEYDILLSKPVSPFFLSCFKMFDFMDLATMVVAIGFLFLSIHELPYQLSCRNIGLALLAWICSFVMAICLNVLIASLAFWITEIENGIWIYRDLVYVGRFPPEVYSRGIQMFFFYIIPIILIVSTPTKAVIGQASTGTFVWMLIATCILIGVSALTWQKALRRYASASS